MTWAVFAGGGTGGHLYPGLAVARELVARGHDTSSLHFVGARRGLEGRAGALDGFPSTLLPGRGLSRRISLTGLAENIGALAGEAAAVGAALRLFASWRPAVVVSLGGYAALPCVAAAGLHRVPLVVVNVDAVAGMVNRIGGRFAAVSALGAPGPDLRRAVVTGVPVRAEMAVVDRSSTAKRLARERLGLPCGATVVAISGGSLGSRRINEAAVSLAELWAEREDVAIYHVVGRRDWDLFSQHGSRATTRLYRQVPYEEDMAALYAAADVAVHRAGANTVAELAVAGMASILVPLPGAPGDHQGANARAMQAARGAVVVLDPELDGARLALELGSLVADPERLARMGAAARSLARPDAAKLVADLVEKFARSTAKVSTGARNER